MKINGEIVLIDKDDFEREFCHETLKRLNLSTEVKHFRNPLEGLDYLKKCTEKIFVVISLIDFGRGNITGLDLKRKINEDPNLLLKAVPFVFMSYLDDKETIHEAYKLNIQGYFKKPLTLAGSEQLLSTLFSYWSCNLRPDETL